MSIAWGPVKARDAMAIGGEEIADEGEWEEDWIVTGCSDSSLRKWDVASGRVRERMAVDKIKGERTIVWAVGVLG